MLEYESMSNQSTVLIGHHRLPHAHAQNVLYSALILHEGLTEPLQPWQNGLCCGLGRFLVLVAPGRPESESWLSGFAVVVHLLLHEHHAGAFSSESLAGVEASIAVGGVGLRRALLEERDFSFVEGGEAIGGGSAEGVDVLGDLIVGVGFDGKQLVELAPLHKGRVGFLDHRQEDPLDEGSEDSDEFLIHAI